MLPLNIVYSLGLTGSQLIWCNTLPPTPTPPSDGVPGPDFPIQHSSDENFDGNSRTTGKADNDGRRKRRWRSTELIEHDLEIKELL